MTTNYLDITSGLLSYVETNLASIDSGYSAAQHVAWPNVELHADGLDDWMEVQVEFNGARRAELGSASERIDGTLALGFFARDTEGLNELAQRIDGARDLFAAGTTVSSNGLSIRFRTPQAVTLDPNVAEWGRMALLCPWIVYT